MDLMTPLSKHVFYPMLDLKDRSHRLTELKTLMESQWFSADDLRSRQWDKLREIAAYAYDQVPHYNKIFDQHGVTPGFETYEEFQRLPILTKKDIRQRGDELLSSEYEKDALVEARTGGSTGKALTLYFDEACQARRNAAAMRSDRWAGWDLGVRTAALWGNPPVARTVKAKLRSALLDRIIYLDTMNLNEKSMTAFVNLWRKYKPRVVYGHAHSIYIFARFLRDSAITDVRPRGIISTSMMLLEHDRRTIESVFGCPVTDRYGCEEVGLIGCECERHDGMHLNVEHVYVEFLKPDGTEAAPGEAGDIVVTDLLNRGMPLIRYKVEDVGIRPHRACACGRGQPLMQRVAGRVADFLKKTDGSLVSGISLVERTLTAVPGIAQMQLVQDRLGELKVKLVQDDAYDDETERRLNVAFSEALGDSTSIQIVHVDGIDQDPSGKYRFSICRV